MSKASRQSIALLAIVHGVIKTIQEFELAPELAPTILYAETVCEECVTTFPGTGDARKNVRWVIEKIHCINDDLNKSDSVYTMIVLVSLAHHIITDLTERIRDPHKLQLLEPLVEVIAGVSDQIDPMQDCFEAYEEADGLLIKLYGYLGFTQ